MATDNLEISNKALRLIAAEELSSAMSSDVTSDTPSSKEDKVCQRFYTHALKKVLGELDWNFARKRYHIEDDDNVKTITAITAADPAVVTSAAHGYVVADSLYIYDVTGMTEINGKTVLVSAKDANTFTLYDESGQDLDASAYTAYVSGGSVRRRPLSSFEYAYDLPSDFHVDRTEANLIKWEIEGIFLVTDAEEVDLTYTALITDTTLFPIWFEDALVDELASLISFPISKDREIKENAIKDALVSLDAAKTVDTRMGLRRQDKKTHSRSTGQSTWLSRRR